MIDIAKPLINWYSENKRDLPWRRHKEVYFVWLSEIILQQTRVEQGLPYYYKFTSEFPTIHHLAKADEEDVLKTWQGLGYYSRARNLHATAKYISAELNGKFPQNYTGLLKLKGVGPYTAAAISSICFNEKRAVVDGNVYRVIARLLQIETPINSTAGKKMFEQLANQLIDETQPGEYNQAMMELGATICTPKNYDCNHCPINQHCLSFQHENQHHFPVKIKRHNIRSRFFYYLIWISELNEVFIQKRTDKDIWNALYEFPMVESDKKLKIKEIQTLIQQTYGADIVIEQIEEHTKHILSHQHIYSTFLWLKSNKEPHFKKADKVPLSEVKRYPVSKNLERFLGNHSIFL